MGANIDELDLKRDIETVRQDVDLGQVLAVDATPEEESRVRRKLDFLCVSAPSCQVIANTWQFDSIDGMCLLPSIPRQAGTESSHSLQSTTRSGTSLAPLVYNQADSSGHARLSVLLDISHLLLWLFVLELPQFICDCPSANWKIPGYLGVGLPFPTWSIAK